MSIEAELRQTRVTKNTVRYELVDEKGESVDFLGGAQTGALYILKAALPQQFPQTVKMTIDW